MNERKSRTSLDTQKLVYIALLTAIVVILQSAGILTGMFSGLSINLSLVPIVVGAVLCGRKTAAWLGLVSGIVVLFDPSTVAYLQFNAVATVFLCLLKGAMSGFLAALVYDAFKKWGRYRATLLAGVTAPIVNTGIFILGSVTIFYEYAKEQCQTDTFAQTLFAMLGIFLLVNVIIELVSSIALSPVVVRIIDTRNKE